MTDRADELQPIDDPNFDQGVTYAIVQLAELVGAKGWQLRDGSEDYRTDVRDTILDVLRCAGIYDAETGNYFRCWPQRKSVIEAVLDAELAAFNAKHPE